MSGGLKPLNDTFIFKHLNTGNMVSNAISHAITTGTQVHKEDMEEAFMLINKNFKFPLKYPVMDAVDKGQIILMYVDGRPLPTCMPFFLTKKGDDVVAVVCVNVYGRKTKSNDQINIDPKKLYCMMEGAYLARKMVLNPKAVTSRTSIITYGSEIYAHMFVRILNKKYSLNLDKIKMNKVIFLASKFYLVNILGHKNDDMATNYALKNCINANPVIIREFDRLIDDSVYESFPNFIDFLKDNGFSDISTRGFLEQYIYTYDAAALLSIEVLPYFIYNIISVTTGAYINNQYVLEDIVGAAGSKIYVDLANNLN